MWDYTAKHTKKAGSTFRETLAIESAFTSKGVSPSETPVNGDREKMAQMWQRKGTLAPFDSRAGYPEESKFQLKLTPHEMHKAGDDNESPENETQAAAKPSLTEMDPKKKAAGFEEDKEGGATTQKPMLATQGNIKDTPKWNTKVNMQRKKLSAFVREEPKPSAFARDDPLPQLDTERKLLRSKDETKG